MTRIVIALLLIGVSQQAMAGGTVRDHRGSQQNLLKPSDLPQTGRGGYAAIEAANKGKGTGPIIRDHRN